MSPDAEQSVRCKCIGQCLHLTEEDQCSWYTTRPSGYCDNCEFLIENQKPNIPEKVIE